MKVVIVDGITAAGWGWLVSLLSSLFYLSALTTSEADWRAEAGRADEASPASAELSCGSQPLQYHNNNNSGRRGEGLTLYFSIPSCKPTLFWKLPPICDSQLCNQGGKGGGTNIIIIMIIICIIISLHSFSLQAVIIYVIYSRQQKTF